MPIRVRAGVKKLLTPDGDNRLSDLLFQAGLKKVLQPGFCGLEE
jgi:hypothetical protein